MKRMRHPQHGFHHAYSPQEEETLRKNGWVIDEGGVYPDGTPISGEDIESLRAQLDARGIKYHPRAGIEKLKALL